MTELAISGMTWSRAPRTFARPWRRCLVCVRRKCPTQGNRTSRSPLTHPWRHSCRPWPQPAIARACPRRRRIRRATASSKGAPLVRQWAEGTAAARCCMLPSSAAAAPQWLRRSRRSKRGRGHAHRTRHDRRHLRQRRLRAVQDLDDPRRARRAPAATQPVRRRRVRCRADHPARPPARAAAGAGGRTAPRRYESILEVTRPSRWCTARRASRMLGR